MWKSTDIHNYSDNSNMAPTFDANTQLPELKTDGRMNVYLNGNYFVQNGVIIPNHNNIINIHCVFQLDPISSSKDTTYTIQNALFGAVKLLKMLIPQNMLTKDMAYVLMKVVCLVKGLLGMEETY